MDHPIALIGRVSTWRRRLRLDGGGGIWGAWLSHRRHGTIGIFLPEEQVGDPDMLPGRTQVLVEGGIQYVAVGALADDPLIPAAPSQTAMLVQVRMIDQWDRETYPPPLPSRTIRIHSARVVQGVTLAGVTNAPDLVYAGTETRLEAGGGLAEWNHLHGVIAICGARRYLRYVLCRREAGTTT